jgi:hypothetical protein
MNKELVYIKDNIENTHYIYTNEIDLEYDFSKCYDWLKDKFKTKYPESLVDLRYTITDNTCKIYCEEESLQKGWIWNSVDTKERVLYELSKIQIGVVVENIAIETTSVGTMTEPELKKHFVSVGMLTEPIIEKITELVPLKKTHCGTIYDKYFDTTSDFTNDFSHWCSTELEPVITNISKLSLGNDGYAPNPFTPINTRNPFLSSVDDRDALTIELKRKLSEPNYGLRSVNF